MSRDILSLFHEQLTAFHLNALIAYAEALNQHNRDPCTTSGRSRSSRSR
jgi:hypothetical protein